MFVQWLIQRNHPDPSAARDVAGILSEIGRDAHLVDLKGRTSELPDLGMLDPSRPTVCWGPSFVPRAFGLPELSPGIFFDPATFRWSAFREAWGDLMLSRDAEIVSAHEAVDTMRGRRMFVRPDEDSKSFDGGVFDPVSLNAAIMAGSLAGLLRSDTDVVVAEPVQVDVEWRTFVVGGKVVAASSYRECGKSTFDLHVPRQVVDLAFDAAALWTPADVFCLDVASSSGRYGIVEANCFSASRFYGADVSAILSAVSEFVESVPRPGLGSFGAPV